VGLPTECRKSGGGRTAAGAGGDWARSAKGTCRFISTDSVRFRRFNSVTVRRPCGGRVEKVAFTEGQDVHAGDLLAQVDSDPFRAQVSSRGEKAQDGSANWPTARIELERDKSAASAVAKQVIDTQQALVINSRPRSG